MSGRARPDPDASAGYSSSSGSWRDSLAYPTSAGAAPALRLQTQPHGRLGAHTAAPPQPPESQPHPEGLARSSSRSSYDRPAYDRPAYDRIGYDRPAYDRPAYDRLAYDAAPPAEHPRPSYSRTTDFSLPASPAAERLMLHHRRSAAAIGSTSSISAIGSSSGAPGASSRPTLMRPQSSLDDRRFDDRRFDDRRFDDRRFEAHQPPTPNETRFDGRGSVSSLGSYYSALGVERRSSPFQHPPPPRPLAHETEHLHRRPSTSSATSTSTTHLAEGLHRSLYISGHGSTGAGPPRPLTSIGLRHREPSIESLGAARSGHHPDPPSYARTEWSDRREGPPSSTGTPSLRDTSSPPPSLPHHHSYSRHSYAAPLLSGASTGSLSSLQLPASSSQVGSTYLGRISRGGVTSSSPRSTRFDDTPFSGAQPYSSYSSLGDRGRPITPTGSESRHPSHLTSASFVVSPLRTHAPELPVAMSAKSKASDIPSRNAIRTSSSTSYTSGAGVYRGYGASGTAAAAEHGSLEPHRADPGTTRSVSGNGLSLNGGPPGSAIVDGWTGHTVASAPSESAPAPLPSKPPTSASSAGATPTLAAATLLVHDRGQPAQPRTDADSTLPLPGAIREHSKFVEALLRSSSRQMESTTPTPGAATPELRDARDSLSTPLASVHAGTSSAPATMATPASTSDITTPGSKTAIPSPAPALATTEPLLPRAASSLGSSELDSLRMSVSMVGNLTLLRDITMDVSRIVAESALKGLEPHECSVLKQKVDLQLRCIASLSRSRPLK